MTATWWVAWVVFTVAMLGHEATLKRKYPMLTHWMAKVGAFGMLSLLALLVLRWTVLVLVGVVNGL